MSLSDVKLRTTLTSHLSPPRPRLPVSTDMLAMQALPAESAYPLNSGFGVPGSSGGLGRAHAALPAPPLLSGSAQKWVLPGPFIAVDGKPGKATDISS